MHHGGPKRETKAECTMGELGLWSLGMEEEKVRKQIPLAVLYSELLCAAP